MSDIWLVLHPCIIFAGCYQTNISLQDLGQAIEQGIACLVGLVLHPCIMFATCYQTNISLEDLGQVLEQGIACLGGLVLHPPLFGCRSDKETSTPSLLHPSSHVRYLGGPQ